MQTLADHDDTIYPCLQAEGAWSGRASHVYEAARLLMLVSVTPVTLADQGRWGGQYFAIFHIIRRRPFSLLEAPTMAFKHGEPT